MTESILQVVRGLALTYALPYTAIDHGAMPQENGLAMYIGSGGIDSSHMDRGALQTLTIALNGKHSDLETVLGALSRIHVGLTQLLSYPYGDTWEITTIDTAITPSYLDREESRKQWLYGSSFYVRYYMKGVCE